MSNLKWFFILAISFFCWPSLAYEGDIMKRYLVNCDGGIGANGVGHTPCVQISLTDLFATDRNGRLMTQTTSRGSTLPVVKDDFAKNWLRVIREHYGEEKFSFFLDGIVKEPRSIPYVQIPEKNLYQARAQAQEKLIKELQEARDKKPGQAGYIDMAEARKTTESFQESLALAGKPVPQLVNTKGTPYRALKVKDVTQLQQQAGAGAAAAAYNTDPFLTLEEAIILCDYEKPKNTKGYRDLKKTFTTRCPSIDLLEDEIKRATSEDVKRQAALRIRAMKMIDMHARSQTGNVLLSEAFDKVQMYNTKNISDIKTNLSERMSAQAVDAQDIKSKPLVILKTVNDEAKNDYVLNDKSTPLPKSVDCVNFDNLAKASSAAVRSMVRPR